MFRLDTNMTRTHAILYEEDCELLTRIRIIPGLDAVNLGIMGLEISAEIGMHTVQCTIDVHHVLKIIKKTITSPDRTCSKVYYQSGNV